MNLNSEPFCLYPYTYSEPNLYEKPDELIQKFSSTPDTYFPDLNEYLDPPTPPLFYKEFGIAETPEVFPETVPPAESPPQRRSLKTRICEKIKKIFPDSGSEFAMSAGADAPKREAEIRQLQMLLNRQWQNSSPQVPPTTVQPPLQSPPKPSQPNLRWINAVDLTPRSHWSDSELDLLKEGFQAYGPNWVQISKLFSETTSRYPQECETMFYKLHYTSSFSVKPSSPPQKLGIMTKNSVDTPQNSPEQKPVKRERPAALGKWSSYQNDLLLKLHREIGTDWDEIAKKFPPPGKTAIECQRQFIKLKFLIVFPKPSLKKPRQKEPQKSESRITFSLETNRDPCVWSDEDRQLLLEACQSCKEWERIANDVFMGTRSAEQCRDYYEQCLKVAPYEVKSFRGSNEKKWSKKETARLMKEAEKCNGQWEEVAKHIPFTTPEQCEIKYGNVIKRRDRRKALMSKRKTRSSSGIASDSSSSQLYTSPDLTPVNEPYLPKQGSQEASFPVMSPNPLWQLEVLLDEQYNDPIYN